MNELAARDGGADRFGPFRRAYRLGGLECTVQTDESATSDVIDRYLMPFRTEIFGESARRYFLASGRSGLVSLSTDGVVRMRQRPVVDAVDFLVWEVCHDAIDTIDGVLGVHAGSVSWGGRGVVVPAPSGSGKSTLTAGMTAAGCGYLSDEMALLDLSSGTVEPFPRPLWLSPHSVGLVPGLGDRLAARPRESLDAKLIVPPDALRPSPLGGPCPLECVIVLELDPGGQTVLEPIKRAEAILALMTNSFNMGRFKGPGVVALGALAPRITAYRLRMGELTAAVELVMNALSELPDSVA